VYSLDELLSSLDQLLWSLLIEEWAVLWNVDLGLAVLEGHLDGAAWDLLAVAAWVEDVADGGAISPWSVWNRDVLSVLRVGQGNEEVSSGEGVEVVLDVFLLNLAVPDRVSLSCSVNSRSESIDVRAGIHVLPEWLSVLWIVSASVSLLTTIVVEWDTSWSKGEEESILEHSLVVVLVQESSIVVVVDEDTKGIDIFEVWVFLLESVFDSIHRLTWSKNILDGKVHWIVEETLKLLLIWSNVGWITVEAFSHLEDSRSLSKLRPEVVWYLWDGIDSNTIKAKVINQIFDPRLEIPSNIIVSLVQIWKTSKSAVFNFVLVTPIVDITVAVVMLTFV
jgi:hypothetical protein